MPLIIRTLLPGEYHRIAQFPGPLGAVAGTVQIDPDRTRLCIIEDPDVLDADGRPVILGYWTLFQTVHAEPLYLDPSIRRHPKVAFQLLSAIIAELQATSTPSVFAIIEHENLAVMGPMAERLGLRPLPGILYGGQVLHAGDAQPPDDTPQEE